MAELAQVDAVQVDFSRAKVVEDNGEDFRVTVYEDCTLFVAEAGNAAAQEGGEEGFGD